MDNPAKSKQKSRTADSPTAEANREHASQKHTQSPLVTPISDVVAPMKWPSSTPKLFDSSSGLTHYFVRPNDSFVLNTLELLDADAYLYRLLKQEGYENITFVEVKSTECRIYAYDAQSESVFKAKSATEKKDRKAHLESRSTAQRRKQRQRLLLAAGAFANSPGERSLSSSSPQKLARRSGIPHRKQPLLCQCPFSAKKVTVESRLLIL